jgi:diketogulonate reductase-like aldo/keto reductase
MAAMQELVESGKVRFIGVSNFSLGEMEEAQAALSKSKIVSNQVQYSLIDRAIEHGLLQHCESNGITVLAFSLLAAGLANIREWDCDDTLGRIAAEIGKTRAQVALNWCVRHRSVSAIVKAHQIQHVRENCAVSGWTLSRIPVDALERVPHRRQGLSLIAFAGIVYKESVGTFDDWICCNCLNTYVLGGDFVTRNADPDECCFVFRCFGHAL